jgi:hypothetical protein
MNGFKIARQPNEHPLISKREMNANVDVHKSAHDGKVGASKWAPVTRAVDINTADSRH